MDADVLADAQIERAEGTEEVDAGGDLRDGAAGVAGVGSGARRQRVPAIDCSVELVTVLDLAREGVARKDGQARAGGAVDARGAGEEGVCRNSSAEGVERRDADAPGQLGFAVKGDAMALIGERVALLFAQSGGAFDQVHLLVLVAVFELIVVGVVERLRKRIADIEVVADASDMASLPAHAHQQTVVPALRGGVDDRYAVRDAGERVGDQAELIVSRALDVRRRGGGAAQKVSDEFALAKDVQAVRTDEPVAVNVLLHAKRKLLEHGMV